MKKMISSSYRIVPVTVIMGTIFFLSHQPGTESQFILIPGFDKMAHAFIYGVLAAAGLYALPSRTRKAKPILSGKLIVLFCLLYGVLDEYHQSFIPGRESSIGDVAADAAGAIFLVIVWLQFFRPDAE